MATLPIAEANGRQSTLFLLLGRVFTAESEGDAADAHGQTLALAVAMEMKKYILFGCS